MKITLSALLSLLAAPALAHVGDHGGMSLAQVAAHVFETDHIVFALIAAGVGALAYRAGRKAGLRHATNEARHDPR